MKSSRNSSIELLRILSMFAIVLHHYAYHSTLKWTVYNLNYSGSLRINLFLHYIGKLGVVIFVMIGAYFLCKKRFNFQRPLNLTITMFFYSFSIYIVMKYILRLYIWGPDTLERTLLPFPLPSGYWFVYSYIVMLLFMPLLNIIINSLSQAQLKYVILGLTILWSFLTVGLMIFNNKPDTTVDDFGYTPATYFILIYFVGAYIRLYGNKGILSSRKKLMLGSIICLMFTAFLAYGSVKPKIYQGMLALFDLNSPIVLISAVFIFSYFKCINWKNRYINYIASSMFGVYLIHENSFIRPYLWTQIISSQLVAKSPVHYLLLGLTYSILVFICCVIMDIFVRKLLVEKYINRCSMWIANYLKYLINK